LEIERLVKLTVIRVPTLTLTPLASVSTHEASPAAHAEPDFGTVTGMFVGIGPGEMWCERAPRWASHPEGPVLWGADHQELAHPTLGDEGKPILKGLARPTSRARQRAHCIPSLVVEPCDTRGLAKGD
jgi:hypothetical protein